MSPYFSQALPSALTGPQPCKEPIVTENHLEYLIAFLSFLKPLKILVTPYHILNGPAFQNCCH